MTIIAITGWSGTGKTTLANRMLEEPRYADFALRSTDGLISMGWSEASEAASHWFDSEENLIIEGVAVPRALRKWKARNPSSPAPVSALIVLRKVYKDLAPGAVSQGKGHDTVMTELKDWLRPVIAHR